MKKLFTLLFVTIFLFQFCRNGAEKKTTKIVQPSMHTETPNEIIEVSVSMFGGKSTIISRTYIITKDSVHYSLLAHDTTQNIVKSYSNTQQDWNKLIETIELEKFRNTENGTSHQEYDGNDMEITITTQSEKIVRLNAEKDKSWDRIFRQLVETYFK